MPQGIVITILRSLVRGSYEKTQRELGPRQNRRNRHKHQKDAGRTSHHVGRKRRKSRHAESRMRVLGLEVAIRDTSRPIHLEVIGISCMGSIEDVIADTKSDQYPNEDLRLVSANGGTPFNGGEHPEEGHVKDRIRLLSSPPKRIQDREMLPMPRLRAQGFGLQRSRPHKAVHDMRVC